MTTKEFCDLMGGSNGRKAMVLAIQRDVPDGPAIIQDEHEAYQAYRLNKTREASQKLAQCRQRRNDAEQFIRAKYQLGKAASEA